MRAGALWVEETVRRNGIVPKRAKELTAKTVAALDACVNVGQFNEDADRDALYEEIGRLKMELDWLKKKAGLLD